jgi:hypothetical protein
MAITTRVIGEVSNNDSGNRHGRKSRSRRTSRSNKHGR